MANQDNGMRQATERAVELAGGPTALGRAIGRSRQTIHNWLSAGRIPTDDGDVLAVEEAIKGQVSRHQLRPDVYPK